MSGHSGMTLTALSLAVNLMIVGAFFALGIGLAFRLGRSLPPRLRYVAAVVGFLAAAALPINSTLLGARELAAALPVAARVETGRRPSTADAVSNRSENVAVHNSDESAARADAPPVVDQPRRETPGMILALLGAFVLLSAESWLGTGFLCLWIFVALVLLGREALGYMHLARARRTWRLAGPKVRDELRWPEGFRLFISEHEGPYTAGLFRPVVVLPAGLLEDISVDEARLIARHELAHARWRDPSVNALVRVVRALLWPSLPLWFLARVARLEREAASDLSAVAASGHGELKGAVTEYAALLVSVARMSGRGGAARRAYHWAATEVGEHVDLESRVLRLLTFSPRTTRTRLLLAALALTATAGGAASLPLTVRPVLFTPGTMTNNSAVVEQDDVSPAGRGSDALHVVSENLAPATEGGTAESTAAAQTVPVREHDESIAGPALTPTSAPAGEHEAGRRFATEAADLGYTGLSPEQLDAMKAHGVSAAYVAEMAASGYGGLPADALINFRLLGVDSGYVSEMRKLGYGALPPNTVIDFRLYGVDSAYIKELASAGLSGVPAAKLVAFRRRGIDAGYIKRMRSEISGGLSPDQLLALRKLGVTEGHVKELKARGVENLTAERVIDARTQKVAAGTPVIGGDTDNE